MIKLNCGNKWDIEYLNSINKLNKTISDIRIAELYGCPAGYLDVRTSDRHSKLDIQAMESYIDKAHYYKLDINFTLNTSCIGTPITFDLQKLQNIVNLLEDMGVDRFTIYSPYIMQEINFTAPVELSTIHNQTNVNYIAGLINAYPIIDKVCLPIYMNRDFSKLKYLIYAFPNIRFELIVNEFCVAYNNTCFYRAECYNMQSHSDTSFHYPFDKCTQHRKENPVAWLKCPFILPEWLDYYNKEIGIDSFKLTGRTHPIESILKIITHYLHRNSGELLIQELWGIGLPGQKLLNTRRILAKDIDKLNFLSKFQNHFDCETTLCKDCQYCMIMLDKLIEQGEADEENK